jgi:hypothetical protein
MIRLLLREALLTLLLFVLVSIVGFVALDRTGKHDWWDTLPYAVRAGIPEEHALARDLPTVWNRRVRDAALRSLDDMHALGVPSTRADALVRLRKRGTAALPTLLAHLDDGSLSAEGQREVLAVLASMAPALSGGEVLPTEHALAVEW